MSATNRRPDFTAIIPAFNEELFVARAIDSVLSQTIRPEQIVVVDDGSTDGTAAVVDRYAADGVEYVLQRNAGPASARNTGIRAARGKYVGFLDADDEWKEHCVADVKGIFERYPDLVWATTPYEKLFENGTTNFIRSVSNEISKGDLIEDYFEAEARFRFSCCSCIFIRRDVFDCVGNFDTSIAQYGEDLDMWFRIALRYPQLGYADRVGAVYWARAGSAMDKDPRDIAHHVMRIRKAEGHSILSGDAAEKMAEPLLMDWIWTQTKDAAELGNKSMLDHIWKLYGRRMPAKRRLVLDLARWMPFKFLWGPARRAMTRNNTAVRSPDKKCR